MNKYPIIGILILLIGVPGLTYSQDFSITADVDRTRISVNDLLVMTVTVSGQDLKNVPEPALPDLDNFLILGQTSSTTSSFNFMNGRISSSQTIRYIYQLQPNAMGDFVIDAITASYEGKRYRTKPITVEVVQGTAQTPPKG
ncbi:MAG: BatD family protein, partial [Candidatus Latescibacteria bacterium]|nr:BatD family protein [Candidatus Latescibacterota bacterium]